MFKKLLEAFSPSSFFQRFNKRRLQQEIDTHRLFLLTRYKHNERQGLVSAVDEFQKEATETPFEEQRKLVQENVHHQITFISRLLHSLLTPGWEQAQIDAQERLSRTKRQSGLSMAVGGGASQQPGSELRTDVRTTSREELSAKLKEALGYTLRLGPSEVEHADAGTGLFLSGVATPGSVVALYPGVIYDPSQYRQIPGYPRIDRDNPYFIARFDGVVIDGKPWGTGGGQRLEWDGLTNLEEFRQRLQKSDRVGFVSRTDDSDELESSGQERGRVVQTRGPDATVAKSGPESLIRVSDAAVSDLDQPAAVGGEDSVSSSGEGNDEERGTKCGVSSQVTKSSTAEGLGWWRLVAVGEGRAGSSSPAQGGTLLETRHPLALAHFANHPGNSMAPNVVVCPYDFHPSSPGMEELRPYVPNALCPDKGPKERADTPIGYRSIWESRDDEDENLDRPKERTRRLEVVRTLVLVASKEIRDEEVLLNYRLSPHVKRPDWYHPVDADEDKRRWS